MCTHNLYFKTGMVDLLQVKRYWTINQLVHITWHTISHKCFRTDKSQEELNSISHRLPFKDMYISLYVCL